MEPPLIPARMLNEVVYCPRLFALEYVNGEWESSSDTVRGNTVHRRVDQPTRQSVPAPDQAQDDDELVVARSVTLSDAALGIVAKVDLIEAERGQVVPVDYKKGELPDVAEGAWLPERVQICAQALVLRAHGHQVPHGVLYFAGSRRRVIVELTPELEDVTHEAVARARAILASGQLPEPLENSPKCWGCSLVGLCLPDEHHVLNARATKARPLAPPREQGLPLYVEARGAKLARKGGEIVVKAEGEIIDRVRLSDTSRIVVRGAASVTTPLLERLATEGIPLAVHGWSGRWLGSFVGAGGHNVLGRMAQFRAAFDARASLALARRMVHGKICNQRVLLRRNHRQLSSEPLDRMKALAEDALTAPSVDALYGVEGNAARVYFEHFPGMLKDAALAEGFDLDGRNRRPPKDPVNALLSLAYAFLVREVGNVLGGIGLDPWVGFLHRPRAGKPALALDLMEEFRPLLADSVVLTVLNRGSLGAGDFHVRHTGVSLKDGARKQFIRAFETRLAQETTHPAFATPMSYRRVVEVQGRLLCKALLGEIEAYPPLKVR